MNPSKRRLSRYGWRPADPPRRPVLFINPRSGDGKAARAGLAERAREKGIEAVILDPDQDLAALAGDAAAATGRWRSWPRWRRRTRSRSCASRPGRATTSRSTSAWTGTT